VSITGKPPPGRSRQRRLQSPVVDNAVAAEVPSATAGAGSRLRRTHFCFKTVLNTARSDPDDQCPPRNCAGVTPPGRGNRCLCVWPGPMQSGRQSAQKRNIENAQKFTMTN